MRGYWPKRTTSTRSSTTYEVAVLPFGATEPHNLHLPYGMDVFEGTIVGEKICEAALRAWSQRGVAADDSVRHADEHVCHCRWP